MTNPADSLIVSDSLWVGDPASISTSVSTLSAGIIALNGNFRQVGSPGTGYFSATGTHTTFMTGGAAAPKFINFTDSTASGFQNFTHNGNGIQIPGTGYAKVRGNLVMKSGAGFNGATGRLVVGGTLFGAPTSNVTTRNFELAGVYSDTGTFNPDTAVFSGGTVAVPQVIPDTLTLTTSGPSLKNVRVSGIATMVPNSAQFNWLINGNLIVSGNGSLQIGTGNTITVSVSGTFSTVNNGVLVMNSANSALNVTGNVSFGGGSTTGLLTNGALTLNGSFTQLGSTTSFAPSGSQTTTFGSGGSQSVTFANPVSSTFQNLSISGATTLSLQSDVVALGTLNHSGASAIGITSGATTRLLTVSGLNNAGPATLTLTNTQLKFVDGTTNGTFNNVTFTGFAASSPLTYFEVARTVGGPFTFTSLNFSGTLGAAGRYLVNSGSRSVTLVTVSPLTAVAASICGCVAFNANTGAGTLIWP